jgi:hypothetical protein
LDLTGVQLGETLTVSPFFGWALKAAIGPCTDPRHIKVRVELGFVSSSSLSHPCLLNPLNLPSRNSELDDRRSTKLRTDDKRRRIDCLRRKSGGWLRRKRTGDERRRRNRGGRRRKIRKEGLRRLRKDISKFMIYFRYIL